ncbi:MAG: MFS transporter [Firmicutes bacterium]|nr:MFS transporter [Bacillota bacterium]
MEKLKLNISRTMYIGFAFFTILMLWQVYNTYCPLILNELFISNFGGTATDHAYLIGVIMAADNITALFMIPLFGFLSDRTRGRLGKRMPYIIFGAAGAVIMLPFIALMFMINSLLGVILAMAAVLLIMNVFRNPAVSLMPDFTPKPLRSKANAIINFMGYLGPILIGALIMVFPFKTAGDVVNPNIWVPFAITSAIMIVAIALLALKIRENKLAKLTEAEMKIGEEQAEVVQRIEEDKPLGKVEEFNLWVLLASVFLWFFAFNAIETFGSLFSENIIGESGFWGMAVIFTAVSGLASFLPGAWVSGKIGRKNTILVGLGMTILGTATMSVAVFMGANPELLKILVIGCIFIAGWGWGWININSYPMVVEMSSKKSIGKFTGMYYFFSMLAQSLTPIAVGFLFTALGSYAHVFTYALIFMVIAAIVFSFYKLPKKLKQMPNLRYWKSKAGDEEQQ